LRDIRGLLIIASGNLPGKVRRLQQRDELSALSLSVLSGGKHNESKSSPPGPFILNQGPPSGSKGSRKKEKRDKKTRLRKISQKKLQGKEEITRVSSSLMLGKHVHNSSERWSVQKNSPCVA